MAENTTNHTSSMARAITFNASRQTAWTIQTLVPSHRREDAFRAYAYFRWVDDVLDGESLDRTARLDFLQSQMTLLSQCLDGNPPRQFSSDEWMLVELTQGPLGRDPGLRIYLRNMMEVMAFDAFRRGRRITADELANYSKKLATAVTEAVYTFIADQCMAPRTTQRYLAADAAHIVHMLRDTYEDLEAGYINIPVEVLPGDHVGPDDLVHPQVISWVQSRLHTADAYFKQGEAYLAQVKSPRCRLAGIFYALRFRGIMQAIEREGCLLRPDYSQFMRPSAALKAIPAAIRMLVAPQVEDVPELEPAHYQPLWSQSLVDAFIPSINKTMKDLS